MKTIFTLLTVSVCFLFPVKKAISQNCNSSAGGNGVSSALPSAINVDGNMSDWTTYLNDPDNNSYDNTLGLDLDAPISDAGRDLVRFTFTEDANNLYIFLERAGSTSNSVDIVFYVDINNNDVMELREPVYHINWSGSNGNVSVEVKDYNPSLLGWILNALSLNLDGLKMMGTLSHRGNSGSGSSSGKGSADGRSVEIKIPFSQLTRQNGSGAVIDQLTFGEDFKFHVSTINGSIGSVPGLNSINDNFGGCLTAPDVISNTLPIKLSDFSARYDRANVTLAWESSLEANFSHYVIENSTDGNEFKTTAMVFGSGIEGAGAKYSYIDRSVAGRGGLIHYRLKMVDLDGSVTYSAIRIVKLGEAANTISVSTYPNPVSNELRITIPENWQGKKVNYEVVGTSGVLVNSKQVTRSNQTELLNVSQLNPGLYFIRVNCEGQSAIQKIIKN